MVDGSSSHSSNLLDTPQGSASIVNAAGGTASDSATVCSTSNSCNCVGCCDLNRPNQPLDVSKSKYIQSHLSKERQVGQYCISIQTSWYNKYSWITVCTRQYKIYCRICCLAKQRGLLSNSELKNSSFITEGFGNWNKALERFDMHAKSNMYRKATERLQLRVSSIHARYQSCY